VVRILWNRAPPVKGLGADFH